jgi:hypothetical protein
VTDLIQRFPILDDDRDDDDDDDEQASILSVLSTLNQISKKPCCANTSAAD